MPSITRNIEAGVYDKNRRYSVSAGTRYTSGVWHLPRGVNPHPVIAEMTKVCAEVWEQTWGTIPWDRVQIVTTVLTIQVVVEFRVMED